MKRLLWLLPAAAAGLLLVGRPVTGQQAGDDFGVLRVPSAPGTFPPKVPQAPQAPQTPPRSSLMPRGMEAARPAGPTGAARMPNPYPLTKDAGVWMVCAATYIGVDGADLAQQVAAYLRQQRLTPYIYNRGDEERQKLQQEHEALQKRFPGVPIRRKTYRIEDQYAVLVGGFKDMEEASAAATKIKALPVPELKLASGKLPYELMSVEKTDPKSKAQTLEYYRVSPFSKAMVVRNPLAPNGPAKPKWDPFWKKLNEGEEYSLLKNPKPWTLLVKEYVGGAQVLQSRESKDNSFLGMFGLGGSRNGESLLATEMQAKELAKFLSNPKFGFQTWVLHTRTSSIVCVGGFDGPEDPALLRVQQQLAQLRFSTSASGGTDPIGLMPNPLPIEVPRP